MKNNNQNIVAVIPARSGSKEVPDKNIKSLSGVPLLAYSIAAAKLSNKIQRVIVSTDSQHYADIAEKFGAEVPFLRPKELSADDSTDCEFFKHALNWLEDNEGLRPDLMVHLRPTSPTREVSIIDQAIEYMIKNPEATALRSMHKTHLSPYKMFKKNNEYAIPFLTYNGDKEFYNLPRQKFETTYIPNGYVDIIRSSVMLESGLLHGNKIKIWETAKIADIDVIEDYDFTTKILSREECNFLGWM